MPQTAQQTYMFKAMHPTGSKRMGFRAAVDEAALSEALRKDQLLLLRAWRMPIGSTTEGRLPLKDEAALNEQIHALLSRGVPLVEALEVGASVVSKRSAPRVEKLRELVAAGATFSGACDTVGGFDDVTIAVYRAAERSGDLAGSAQRLSQAARRRLAIAGKAITVMIYPLVVLIIATLLLSILLVFIVPMLAKQIRQINPNLPWFSDVVFTVGVGLRENLMAATIVAGGLVVMAMLARRAIIAGVSRLSRRVPAIGGLLLTVEMSRFFSVMAAMAKSGVPLAEALSAGTNVISHARLREQLQWLRQSLVDGGVLRVLIDRVEALPLATRRLLIAAERSGDLDSAFDALAEDMSDEVDKRSARLLALLEPLIIILMFAVLAPIIVAVAVPMMTVQTEF